MSYTIAKTQSHRARSQLASAAPGVVGPYWVGKDRSDPSIFERVGGEFWLVPTAEMTHAVTRIKGINFPVQLEVRDLHAFVMSRNTVPDALILFRLEYLRGELRAERLSWGEVAELQGLAEHIDPSDVELLEAAGVPEPGIGWETPEQIADRIISDLDVGESDFGSTLLSGWTDGDTVRNMIVRAATEARA